MLKASSRLFSRPRCSVVRPSLLMSSGSKRARVSASGMGQQQEAAGAAGDSFRVPGLQVRNHTISVPLDHSGKVPGRLDVFVREISAPEAVADKLPYLVFLQGGPGFESPRPTEASGWLKAAITSYRVVLMDQRGTGRSAQITTRNLAKGRSTAQAQADYLALFRADSIVRDAEIVREHLVPKEHWGGKWAVLGQSFGGFCALTYLSIAPQGLIEAMLTGGIPPSVHQPLACTDAYRSLYKKLLISNQRYYTRYPMDVEAVQRIVRFLSSQPEGGLRLPSGTLLTPRALQTLGLSGLGSGGGFERLHYLLESFFDAEGDICPSFIKAFEANQPWDTNPLYALLQEVIYAQGVATQWSAQAMRDAEFSAEFDAEGAAAQGRPVFFTGEMVFPWHYDDFAALRPFKDAAHILNTRSDWSQLYNVEVLRQNQVPVVAATYYEDAYVDFEQAQATAANVGSLRQWITNELKHSGIRDDGERVFTQLLGMLRHTILLD